MQDLFLSGKFPTYKELYLQSKKELQKAELESPAFDTLCLFEKVFSMGRKELALYGEKVPSGEKLEEFLSLLRKGPSGFLSSIFWETGPFAAWI